MQISALLRGDIVHNREGIILKNYLPNKHKLTLLCQQEGKIEGILPHIKDPERLKAGVIVHYYVQQIKAKHHLEAIEIVHVPFALVRRDIYFLHHLIELCNYFLPYHCAAPGIFNMIYFLLNSPDIIQYSVSKKIILLHLFADLGLYPEDEQLAQLAQCPVEYGTIPSLHAHQQQALDQWIRHCIMMHPYSNQFKTIPLRYDDE